MPISVSTTEKQNTGKDGSLIMPMPHAIEKTGRSSQLFDLPTKLFSNRIICLNGEVTEESAESVIMQLLWLDADKPNEDINMYINSPGGLVTQGLGIKDIMYTIRPKVNTLGVGQCSSMGSYLLAAGTGKRRVLPNCRVMIHSVSGGHMGTVHEMRPGMQEADRLHDSILKDMAGFSKGKTTFEELQQLTVHDYFMNGDRAVELGLIDEVKR